MNQEIFTHETVPHSLAFTHVLYCDHENFFTNWPKIHCLRKFYPPKNTCYVLIVCACVTAGDHSIPAPSAQSVPREKQPPGQIVDAPEVSQPDLGQVEGEDTTIILILHTETVKEERRTNCSL